MKDLNGLLYSITEELDKGHTVAIFFTDLMSKKNEYSEPLHIDYTRFGFDKYNILDAIKELENQKKITTIDSLNMGWWITKYTEQ